MRKVITEKTVYYFNELSEKAKEKARDWYRQGDHFDESVIEDAKAIGKLLGIDIEKIYYSGFSSQGDGACFVGKYSPVVNVAQKIKEYAPQDEKLQAIAESLDEIQSKHNNSLYATIKQSGRYYHSGCTDIEVSHKNEDLNYSSYGDGAEELKDTLRTFMHWIYEQLEKEYEYTNSNEAVDESILANEYEFTEDGRIA